MFQHEAYDLIARSAVNLTNVPAASIPDDAYIFTNGPRVATGKKWLDFAAELSKQPRLDCKIQRYHRLDDGTFHPTFSQPVTVIIEFDMVLPSVDPYSMFQAQLIGRPIAVCDLDAVAANDQFLASFVLGKFDITFDYIIERGIGLFQKLEICHDWTRRHNALPHLFSSINMELLRADLKVVDMTGKFVKLEATDSSHDEQNAPLLSKAVAKI